MASNESHFPSSKDLNKTNRSKKFKYKEKAKQVKDKESHGSASNAKPSSSNQEKNTAKKTSAVAGNTNRVEHTQIKTDNGKNEKKGMYKTMVFTASTFKDNANSGLVLDSNGVTKKVVPQGHKFRRRDISSQWSAYDGRLDRKPDDSTNQPANFELLIQAPLSSGGHFRSKAEQEWSRSDDLPKDNFALDISSLVHSLSCIPFYQRLDIPEELFSESEMEQMKSDADTNKRHLLSMYEMKSISKRNDSVMKPSRVSECSLLDTGVNSEAENAKMEFPVDISQLTISGPRTPEPLYPQCIGHKGGRTLPVVDLDDDLDALLLPLDAAIDALSTDNETASSANEAEDTPPSSTLMQHFDTIPVKEDLDDWLDSVLELC